MRRLAITAVGAVLGVVLLAACGGDSGAGPTSDPTIDGGPAVCDEPTIQAAVEADFEANYPGSTFVAMEDFRCEDGWALANAEFEASGSTFPTVVFLRAEGEFWVPTTIEEICATPQAESDVPADMYVVACGLD
jgi:hypothetical protein